VSERLRLFVAAEVPEVVRAELSAYSAAAAAVKPDALRVVPPGGLHVTLCFLGDRPHEDVGPLAAALGEAAGGAVAPSVATGTAVWLPGSRRPQVLAVELVDREGALGRLQGRVAAALHSATGWEPERRAFRPHVTVGRVRRGGGHPADDPPPAPKLEFSVPGVALYRSQLGRGPARYTALARVALG
jgi:2'-5' RNA ligase